MFLPSSIDEVTPSWLGQVLVDSGTLEAGDRITWLDHECVGAGIGLLGDLHRVCFRSDAGRESSVVVKLPADNELRRTADALGVYRREIDFYREVAPTVPIRSARVHLALPAEESTDFVLVLEDLGGLTAADQLGGLVGGQAEGAIDAVAQLHAWAWEDRTRLGELGDRFPPLRNETTRALYPSYFESGWASYLSHASREPGAALRAAADRWIDQLPGFLDELAWPDTLCHGDYRADNLFFDEDGSVVMIDFQMTHQGCGISDVAYLVSQSVEDADLGDHERLVRRYCDALEAAGVTYSWDAAWRQYRIAVVFHLVEAVVTTLSWPSLGTRGRQLVLRLVERAERAIEVTGAVSLMPS